MSMAVRSVYDHLYAILFKALVECVLSECSDLGAQRGRQGHCGGVRAAPAQRRDLALVRDALEAGDDDHVAARQLVLDAERAHVDDAGAGVAIVGDDAGLRAGQRDGLVPVFVDGHGQKSHGRALAAREQHVQLAAGGRGRDGAGALQ